MDDGGASAAVFCPARSLLRVESTFSWIENVDSVLRSWLCPPRMEVARERAGTMYDPSPPLSFWPDKGKDWCWIWDDPHECPWGENSGCRTLDLRQYEDWICRSNKGGLITPHGRWKIIDFCPMFCKNLLGYYTVDEIGWFRDWNSNHILFILTLFEMTKVLQFSFDCSRIWTGQGLNSQLHTLCVRINNENDIRYAALWAIACINLHAFAMDHEDDIYLTRDTFYNRGLKLMRKEKQKQRARECRLAREGNEADDELEDDRDEVALLEGKVETWAIKECCLST